MCQGTPGEQAHWAATSTVLLHSTDGMFHRPENKPDHVLTLQGCPNPSFKSLAEWRVPVEGMCLNKAALLWSYYVRVHCAKKSVAKETHGRPHRKQKQKGSLLGVL